MPVSGYETEMISMTVGTNELGTPVTSNMKILNTIRKSKTKKFHKLQGILICTFNFDICLSC